MSTEFSNHALAQIKRRGISKKSVLKTINDYTEIKTSYKGRKLRRRTIGSKILEVVTRTEGPRITVVTAYYLDK